MAVSRPSSLPGSSSARKKRSPKKLEQELEGLMPPYSPDIPQVFNDHSAITRRLKKTLYYGKSTSTDRPSLYLTDLTVESFNHFEDGLDRLNIDLASDLTREACISPCTLVLGLTYLGRLSKLNPDYLHSVSSSRLFFVSVMVASKFLYDDGEDDDIMNDEWAKLTQLDVKEVNAIEREFLHAIDWKVFVSPHQFRDVLLRIEQKIAMQQALKRGWFTYTDLLVLCPSAPPWEAYNMLVQALGGCLLLYTTSVLSIWSATAMMSHAIPLSLEASKVCSAALDHVSVVDSLLQYALLTLSVTRRLSLSMVQWGSQINDTKLERFEHTPYVCDPTFRQISCDCSPELLSSSCMCYLTPTSFCETSQRPFDLPVISDTNNPSSLDIRLLMTADLNSPFGLGNHRYVGSGKHYLGSGDHHFESVPTTENGNALRTDLSLKSASSIWNNGTVDCQSRVMPILVKG